MSKKEYPLTEDTEINHDRTNLVRDLYAAMGIMFDAQRRGDLLYADNLRIAIDKGAECLEKV